MATDGLRGLDPPLAEALIGRKWHGCQPKALRAALITLAVIGAIGIEERPRRYGRRTLLLIPTGASEDELSATLRPVYETVLEAADGEPEVSAERFGRRFSRRFGTGGYVRDVLLPPLIEQGLVELTFRRLKLGKTYTLTAAGVARYDELMALLAELRSAGENVTAEQLQRAGSAVLLLRDPHDLERCLQRATRNGGDAAPVAVGGSHHTLHPLHTLDLGAIRHLDAHALGQLAHAAHHAAHAADAGGGHGGHAGGGGGHH
jgi:hypothetical protein